ncbi:MAG: hypothetical protein CL897_01360 [Dehalococcoidia bacterium]|nr:hypothetical protein [Dehalococcoidia bacterium]HCU99990.1 hypothetical protein [Dehalococcoidia bacterium]|tara:strand:- start:338 stop:1039 length:702 start_codon:yes stop_codon:yes gene_type:complete
MPKVADLASLQQHDDILAGLTTNLSETRADLENDSAHRAAQAAVAEADEHCASLEREQNGLEDEIAILREKISREEGRLYDGTVNLPKELTDLQQEIASLRSHLSDIEDTELALLDKLEAAETSQKEAHAALGREEAATREKQNRLENIIVKVESEIAATNSERESCRGRLTASLLAQYDDLRRRKGGIAVTHLRAGACTGCRVSVPPSARKRSLDPETPAPCPNCERILVGY